MIEIDGIEGMKALVGTHVGWTDYRTVEQAQVDLFAEATGDHQWIHVDVERATRESPFGGPIVHGYLQLSLLPVLLPELWRVRGFKMGLNYGCEKLRFPSPMPVGARMRCGATIESVREVPGGCQGTFVVTIECEGAPKPACVASVVFHYAT